MLHGPSSILAPDHSFRRAKKSFDDKEEHKIALTSLSGVQVLEELCEFNNIFEKGLKKRK